MISVEYLLPFNTKDGICKDINSFNSLVSSHCDISVKDTKLKYRKTQYNYSISVNEVPDQDCSVFHVVFEVDSITDNFQEMLKYFKKTIGAHLKDDIQVIWDGIGFEWSKLLYPRIYQVENLMRKLISKFMLINLGIGWQKIVVPSEVKESIKNSNAKVSHGILYEVDFIQLSNFLFKPYALKDASKLPEVLNGALDGDLTDEKRCEILEFIPKNNWDRYICEIVECESEQLKSKWHKLYDIRCKIAHNNSIGKEDLDNANSLCDYLEPILNNAFVNLDKIEIPEEEKESISLNTIATVHEPTKVFIKNYNELNNGIMNLVAKNREVFDGFISIGQKHSNSIDQILSASLIGKITVSDTLKASLEGIEITKHNLISSSSIESLNTLTSNYRGFLENASSGLYTGIEGLKKSSDIMNGFSSKWYEDRYRDKNE